MNTDNKHFLEVQDKVFAHALENESAPFRFVLENGALFRYFTTHIAKDLEESWDHALEDEAAQAQIERYYKVFADEIRDFIDTMDPELRSELTLATEQGDINKAYTILEACTKMRENSGGD